MKDEEFYVNMAHMRDSDPMVNAELYDETRQFFPAYIWYRPSRAEKGEHVGWCSMCGEFIDEDVFSYMTRGKNNLHNETADCPHCGVRVTLKCEGKMRNYGTLCTDANIAYFYSPEPNLVYIRVFRMQANYSNVDDPFPSFEKLYPTEVVRYRLTPGKWVCDKWSWRDIHKDVATPYEPPLTNKEKVAGLAGAKKTLDNSFLRYHQLGELYANSDEIVYRSGYNYYRDIKYRPLRYLCYFTMYPQMEMVAKLGIHWAIDELVNDRKKNARLLNWKAKTPHEFLRLSKLLAREYLEGYANDKEVLRLVQRGKGESTCAAASIIKQAGANRSDELLDVLRKYKLTAEKLGAYVKKNKITVFDYLDYISGAEGLGYDLGVHNVLLPKKFREAHDEAIKGLAVAEFKKLSKSKQKSLEKRAARYEYTVHGCMFIFPRSATEIVEEGKALGHCVGGYAARHIDGKTTIIFMRKAGKPQKSWYTIEIDGTNVRQAYGKGNRIRPQDDKEACRSYRLWLSHLEHRVIKFCGKFENMRHVHRAA